MHAYPFIGPTSPELLEHFNSSYTFSILKLLDWPNAVNKCKQGNAGLQDLKGRDASISTTKIVPPDFRGWFS